MSLNFDNVKIHQNILNRKMIDFIEYSKSLEPSLHLNYSGKDIVDNNGQCVGWTTLWGHFLSLGQKDKFLAMRQAISSTRISGPETNLNEMTLPPLIQRKYRYVNQDALYEEFLLRNEIGGKASWFKELVLKKEKEAEAFFEEFNEARKSNPRIKPSIILYNMLKAKYNEFKNLSAPQKERSVFKDILEDLFEKYNDRQDLLREIIPVIAVYQQTALGIRQLLPWAGQYSQEALSHLVGSQNIKVLSNTIGIIGKKGSSEKEIQAKLREFLRFYSQFPGIFVKMGSLEHAFGFSVIEEKGEIKYRFFDSNWTKDKEGEFQSLDNIAKYLLDQVKISNGLFDEEALFEFNPWKFEKSHIHYNKNLSSDSFDSLQPLQMLIMKYNILQDKESLADFLAYIEEKPEDLVKRDKDHNYPFFGLYSFKDFDLLDKIFLKMNELGYSQEKICKYAFEMGAQDDLISHIINKPGFNFQTVLDQVHDKPDVLKLLQEFQARNKKEKESNKRPTPISTQFEQEKEKEKIQGPISAEDKFVKLNKEFKLKIESAKKMADNDKDKQALEDLEKLLKENVQDPRLGLENFKNLTLSFNNQDIFEKIVSFQQKVSMSLKSIKPKPTS